MYTHTRTHTHTHAHTHTHREFELAEIEYFVHPHKKEKFPKFKNVADTAPYLYPRDAQFSGEPPKRMRLGEAVEKVECCRCHTEVCMYVCMYICTLCVVVGGVH